MSQWRPGASATNLRIRADLLARCRAFFAARQVMEVETPLLTHAAVSDVNIQSFRLGQQFLQTSPEYAMKRLLAAGSGPIYQICKAFRQEESGRLHNPEFTLLEWYRPGFDWRQLMDEVADLMAELLGVGKIARLSYRDVFQQQLAVDPHRIKTGALQELTRSKIDLGRAELDDTDCLQLLMHHCIEPQLPDYCFIYDYPAAQAALAKVEQDEQGCAVARRFELYGKGMELANAYQELTDVDEQRRRFEADIARRQQQALPVNPLDEKLLAALAEGLPACAGVALGFDRLVMLATASEHINQVISFAGDRA
jgi:lysyl-tRNA synthetase class 2